MSGPESSPHDTAIDETLNRQHVLLIALLAVVIMFEGFDVSVTSVVLPYVSKDFSAAPAQMGHALSAVALGAIAAVFLLRLADRFGRRPILILASGGFAAGALATAFATDLGQYTAFQFISRMLAVTQVAMAYLVVSETLPPAYRGRANGLLGAIGGLGATIPFMLLEAGLSTSWGWRSLFLFGAAPLLMLPLLFAFLRETPVFQDKNWRGTARPSWISQLRSLTAPGLRGRTLLMSLIWFLLNLASVASSVFFTTYAVQERGWQPADIAILGPAIFTSSLLGNLLSGYLLDRIGRRATISLLLFVLGAGTQIAYAAHEHWIIAACWIAIQATYGVWAAAFTLTSELFPTQLRATATGMCNNLIGRWGMVLAPTLVGSLGGIVGGIGPAVIWASIAAYLAIPLLWLGLPETRGARLDLPPV